MSPKHLQQRLDTLEESIAYAVPLLKDWKKEYVLALAGDNPTQRAVCKERISNLEGQISEETKEYESLKQQLNDGSLTDLLDRQTANAQLNRIESGVQDLKYGQYLISGQIDHALQMLLNQYDETQRSAVAEIVSQLNQNQFQLAQTLLNALESNAIPETEIQPVVTSIEQRLATLPPSQANLAGVASVKAIVNDPSLDTKHRLKLFLPIIPIILSYEGELELTGGINLAGAWNWVKKKLLPQVRLPSQNSKVSS